MPNKPKTNQRIKTSKKVNVQKPVNMSNFVTKSWLAKLLPSSASISASAAYSMAQSTPQATIKQSGPVSTRIRHRELFANIVGQLNFSVTDFAINPGNNALFPWLATQAKSWQKYCFHFLKITYYTRTGTTTTGSFTMAVNRDSNESPPSDDVEMSAISGAMEDAPWKTIVMPVDLSDHRGLFVRGPAQPPSTDLKTYDFGRLLLAVSNGVAATPWGRMWIEYDVELMHPVLTQVEDLGRVQSGPTGLSATVLFNGENDEGASGISIVKAADSTNIVTASGFDAGVSYDITLQLFGTVFTALTLTSVSPAVTTVSAPTFAANAGGTYASLFFRFTPATYAPLTFTYAATATTVSTSILVITRA